MQVGRYYDSLVCQALKMFTLSSLNRGARVICGLTRQIAQVSKYGMCELIFDELLNTVIPGEVA